MMRHTSRSVRAALALVVLALCASTLYYFTAPSRVITVYADHPIYDGAAALIEYADLVVVGRPEGDLSSYEPTVRYTPEGRPGIFYTATNVQVSKTLKGSIAGKTVSVIQGAAYVRVDPLKREKDLLTKEGFFPMQKGKPYLLFLKLTEAGNYSIVGVNQGKFNVDGIDEHERIMESQDMQFGDLKVKVLNDLQGRL